jgi:hypothetical protein
MKPADFISLLPKAIAEYIRIRQEDEQYTDLERDLSFLIPNAFDITFRLEGYKRKKVNESWILFAGDSVPQPGEIPVVSVENDK